MHNLIITGVPSNVVRFATNIKVTVCEWTNHRGYVRVVETWTKLGPTNRNATNKDNDDGEWCSSSDRITSGTDFCIHHRHSILM